MKRIFIILCIVYSTKSLFGQDAQFTQYFNNPLYLNPALAGMVDGSRFTMNYRNQWSGVQKGFNTYGFSADINATGMKSGLGYSLIKDIAGTSKLSHTKHSLYFSHKVRLSRRHHLNAGLRVSHSVRQIDRSDLLFADQVINGNAPVSVEPNLLDKANYQEIGFGLVHYMNNIWTGFSISHLSAASNTLLNGGDSNVPLKMSLHGGAVLWSKGHRNDKEELKIFYQLKSQQNWRQLDLGMFYKVRMYSFGVVYRGYPIKRYNSEHPNRDAYALVLKGDFYNGVKIGYSYDFTISSLTNKSGGSHELSLIIERKPIKRRKRIRIPPCIQF